MADDNGTVLEEFNCFFSPFFNVTSVYVDFKEICNFTEPYIKSDIHVSLDDDMYLFYILIPVAILTVVILMVIIILLVRRCLKRNRYVANSEKPIFLMDRQPVIFQNEYNVGFREKDCNKTSLQTFGADELKKILCTLNLIWRVLLPHKQKRDTYLN
jgi:hypothetical protein